MSSFYEIVGISFSLVFLMMTALWIVYLVKRNAGIVDIGWCMGFIITGLTCLLLGEGYNLRKLLLFLMILGWAGRLLWHITNRFAVSEEDPRYQTLRKNWGESNTDFKFLLLFWFQGFLVIILSLPFFLVAQDRSIYFQNWIYWGVGFWLVGFLGETFKKMSASSHQVCEKGFWYYSRHPNYFFEWIIWIGFALFAYPSPWGFLGILSPILILFLLLKVSGIPLCEGQALRSKGLAYKEYQTSTSSFFPWFKKN